MSMETCNEHNDTVVVYQTSQYQSACPFCEALGNVDEAENRIEELESALKAKADEAESLSDEIADLKIEIVGMQQ